MNFHVLTLFPNMIDECVNYSIIGRAKSNNLIGVNCINIRDFTNNKHKKVDDYPYGGGPGMVMQPEPIYNAYNHIIRDLSYKPKVVYLTPQGKTFNQKIAKEYSKENDLILLCGHYEGIDERVIEEIVTDEISIGDYILTGGELGALILIDAISRLIPGVLNKSESFEDESFSNNLLEYPQYTRPEVFLNKFVPKVLLSGHHENINKWRRQQSVIRTYEKRPDLLKKVVLTEEDKNFLYKYNEIIKKNIENK